MANFPSYTQKDFKPSQNFIARDPAGSGTLIRVSGQGILDAAVAEILAQDGLLQAIDTLTEAVATDYSSGVYVLVGGDVAVLDGNQAIYRVSDAGSGGTVMDNGNELVLLFQGNSGDAGNYNVGPEDDEISLNADLGSAAFLPASGTIYTTENLNIDTFGGDGTDEIIAIGHARSTSLARMYFPVSALTPYDSISLSTGTFSLRSSANPEIESGITLASISIPTTGTVNGSNKMAILDVAVSATLIDGDPYILVAETSSSKIVFSHT